MSVTTDVRPTPLLVATLAKRWQEIEQCWTLHDPEAHKQRTFRRTKRQINRSWRRYNDQLEKLYKTANQPQDNPVHNLLSTIRTTRRDYQHHGRIRKPLAERLDYLKKRKDRVRRTLVLTGVSLTA